VIQEKKNGCCGNTGVSAHFHVRQFFFIAEFSQGSAGASPYREKPFFARNQRFKRKSKKENHYENSEPA
jgi:hypothetical protein